MSKLHSSPLLTYLMVVSEFSELDIELFNYLTI